MRLAAHQNVHMMLMLHQAADVAPTNGFNFLQCAPVPLPLGPFCGACSCFEALCVLGRANSFTASSCYTRKSFMSLIKLQHDDELLLLLLLLNVAPSVA